VGRNRYLDRLRVLAIGGVVYGHWLLINLRYSGGRFANLDTLDYVAQAEADAHQQAADARTRHNHTGAASATILAAQMAVERQRLEASNTRYEQWSADTHATRDTAGKATAELRRRGHAQPDREPARQPEGEAPLPELELRTSPDNQPAQNELAARLDELRARADQAAQRIAAQQAERQASSDYTARIKLEAQAQAEPGQQARAQEELEFEL
jgi:hypothetical protein